MSTVTSQQHVYHYRLSSAPFYSTVCVKKAKSDVMIENGQSIQAKVLVYSMFVTRLEIEIYLCEHLIKSRTKVVDLLHTGIGNKTKHAFTLHHIKNVGNASFRSLLFNDKYSRIFSHSCTRVFCIHSDGQWTFTLRKRIKL